jgi:hypothetical protein
MWMLERIRPVLAWRGKEKEVADVLWEGLGKANDVLGQLLRDLYGLEEEEAYDFDLKQAAGQSIESVSGHSSWYTRKLIMM